MIDLYGLRIAVVPAASGAGPESGADVEWQQRVSDRLEDRTQSTVLEVQHPDGLWTHHIFANRGRTFCEFAVSPDGRRVTSDALPIVLSSDLFGLLAEPVMRTILRRLGIVSFHGAALARGESCVLLLGGKGAGKSTLAAALVRHGWSLLTDDLARVARSGEEWCVAGGFRQLKLRADAVEWLGPAADRLEPRWLGPGATVPDLDKRVLRSDLSGAGGYATLRWVYALRPRVAGLATPRVEAIPPIDRFRTLVANLSEDALHPNSPPPRAAIEVVAAMLRRIDVRALVMPDDLSRVIDFAGQFDGSLAGT